MIRIPVSSAPHQTFTMTLENRRVDFDLRWLTAVETWVLSLTIDGVLRLSGKNVLLSIELLKAYNFGIGAIFLYSTELGDDPGRYDLDQSSVIVSATEAEIVASVQS